MLGHHGVERHLGTVSLGAQVPVLARAVGVGRDQAVLVGATAHHAVGQTERVLGRLRGGGGPAGGGDHLDAVARGLGAQGIEVGDAQQRVAAGAGTRAIEHQAATAQLQRAAIAHVGARHRERAARQRDRAGVVQRAQGLVESADVQRARGADGVRRCGAEHVDRARTQRAAGDGRRAAVGARPGERRCATHLVHAGAAGDGRCEAVCAGVVVEVEHRRAGAAVHRGGDHRTRCHRSLAHSAADVQHGGTADVGGEVDRGGPVVGGDHRSVGHGERRRARRTQVDGGGVRHQPGTGPGDQAGESAGHGAQMKDSPLQRASLGHLQRAALMDIQDRGAQSRAGTADEHIGNPAVGYRCRGAAKPHARRARRGEHTPVQHTDAGLTRNPLQQGRRHRGARSLNGQSACGASRLTHLQTAEGAETRSGCERQRGAGG